MTSLSFTRGYVIRLYNINLFEKNCFTNIFNKHDVLHVARPKLKTSCHIKGLLTEREVSTVKYWNEEPKPDI